MKGRIAWPFMILSHLILRCPPPWRRSCVTGEGPSYLVFCVYMCSVSCLCVMATGLLCNSMPPVVSFFYFCMFVNIYANRKKGSEAFCHLSTCQNTVESENYQLQMSGRKQGQQIYRGCKAM